MEGLKNGATVIKGNIGGVVLASFRDQFVTWVTDTEGNAHWGHYFKDNLRKALDDFEARLVSNPPRPD